VANPYLQRGEWRLSVDLQYRRATAFFRGSQEQQDLPAVRRTQLRTLTQLSYGWTERDSLQLLIPWVDQRLGLGLRPGGSLDSSSVRGLGDLTLSYQHWFRKPTVFRDSSRVWRGNAAVGFGVKLPTGASSLRDRTLDGTGNNRRLRDVDMASQPGDGGVGFLLQARGFQRVGFASVYFSAAYLLNPRNTNDTVSLASNLFGIGNLPRSARYNSVADQYLANVGVAVPLGGAAAGWSLSLAGRIQGVPTHDLLGRSDGFRFSGYGVAVEPGLRYTRGNSSWEVRFPVTVLRNAGDNRATPGRDSETFAPFHLEFGYAYRFGRAP